MKKKLLVLSVIGLVSLSIVLLRENIILKSKIDVDTDNVERVERKDMLSMMLETDVDSGNYELTTRSEWPTDGYKFNSDLSMCENGGELLWDDVNETIIMQSHTSDKCYVYFDKILPLSEFVIAQYNGIQGNNNIYYHDGSLENGISDNSYRYAGASDNVNNYICLDNTEEACSENNLFRIIGVFDNQVKLIRSSSVGKIYWDSKGSNTWSTSSMNLYLNGTYLLSLETISNKIAETVWKVGGNTYSNMVNVTPAIAYQNEITNAVSTNTTDGAIEYSAKIGLMYASDYFYTAVPSYWGTAITSLDSSGNWINAENYTWTITRCSSSTDQALGVWYGHFSCNPGGDGVDDPYATNPVFYLKSSVAYLSGNGTQDSPIRIN